MALWASSDPPATSHIWHWLGSSDPPATSHILQVAIETAVYVVALEIGHPRGGGGVVGIKARDAPT
eukprot:6529646-Prymnesium_polylepis.1